MTNGFLFRFLVCFIATLAVYVCIITCSGYSGNTQGNLERSAGMNYFRYNVPGDINFAGEPVPLSNFEVRRKFDDQLTVQIYWKSETIFKIKKASRWFPVIEPILKKHGVPDDFKYLAVIESNFNHKVSRKGAAGFWQFLAPTAMSYGLEINDEIDERYNVEKATIAACRYFLDAKERLGSWTLAAASYNSGLPRLQRLMKKQPGRSYYTMKMTAETAEYLYKVMAMKELFERPETYGFMYSAKTLYRPFAYTTVKIDSSINNLESLALLYNTKAEYIKILNPWIKKNGFTNDQKKTYNVKIPKAGHESSYAFVTKNMNDAEKKLLELPITDASKNDTSASTRK